MSSFTTWFADAVKRHDAVSSATPQVSGHVHVVRKDHEPVTIAPVRADWLTPADVERILKDQISTIICLVPKQAHYSWEARELAMRLGSTVHTMKEVFSSLSDEDPRPFLNKDVAYARSRLEQHSKVRELRMVCESSMQLVRTDGLPPITIAVEYQYEFTEEALVAAVKHHPDATALLNANPNGTPTTAALAHAKAARRGLFRLGELMGALNYDGDEFFNCRPPGGGSR